MSRKLGFQIAAVLFGLQGLCLVLAATFFGANVPVNVSLGAANLFVGTVFLQMSLRAESSGDDTEDNS